MKTLKAGPLLKLNLFIATFCGVLAVTGVASAQTIATQPGVSAVTPNLQQVETGPILDVVPYVLSDGYTINLTLIPSLTDFNGYDTPPTIPNVTAGLNVVQLPVVLPDFTIRQVVTTVNVWDNQTVVLGGLISSQVQTTANKLPVVADIPLVEMCIRDRCCWTSARRQATCCSLKKEKFFPAASISALSLIHI